MIVGTNVQDAGMKGVFNECFQQILATNLYERITFQSHKSTSLVHQNESILTIKGLAKILK